jgi:hypothetical protein
MKQSERDQATVGSLQTMATRTWEPPTGQARAAGIMLGLRPADGDHPNYRKYSAGAALLLEVVNLGEDVEAVHEWVLIGEDRRARWRRPVNRGGIA